jgi:predicted ferric reductase
VRQGNTSPLPTGKRMRKRYIITLLACFILLTICTVALGIFRIEVVLKYIDNEVAAKAILFPVNVIYIFGISYLFLRLNKGLLSNKKALWTGILWAVSALVLDLILGYYVDGRTVNYLLDQFNIFTGNTWTIVLLLIAIAPWLIQKSGFIKN